MLKFKVSTMLKTKLILFTTIILFNIFHSVTAQNLPLSIKVITPQGKLLESISEYASGSVPTITALPDSRIAVVHCEGESLCLDILKNNKIILSTNYDKGKAPNISSFNDQRGNIYIVETHESNNTDSLWLNILTVDGKQIFNKEYDKGKNPSIAVYKDQINDSIFIIETHKSNNENTVWLDVMSFRIENTITGDSQKVEIKDFQKIHNSRIMKNSYAPTVAIIPDSDNSKANVIFVQNGEVLSIARLDLSRIGDSSSKNRIVKFEAQLNKNKSRITGVHPSIINISKDVFGLVHNGCYDDINIYYDTFTTEGKQTSCIVLGKGSKPAITQLTNGNFALTYEEIKE